MERKDGETEERRIEGILSTLATAVAGSVTQDVIGRTAMPPAKAAGNEATAGADSIATSTEKSAAVLASTVNSLLSSAQSLGGPMGLVSSLSPLLAGLSRLFGGGAEPAPPALPRFDMPAAQRVSAGITEKDGWRLHTVDYASDGMPRATERGAIAPQVVVQVQAMDSRSFLDRRDEIASAVRQALLESHSLGDVLAER